MSNRCDMCFQIKSPLIPVVPKAKLQVCKACSFKAQQVIGLLEYYNVKLVFQGEFETTLEEPKKPTKPK